MSAALTVDLNGTCQLAQSFPFDQTALSPSGQMCGLSGTFIGQGIFLGNADTFCNVVIQGMAVCVSGPLVLQVQCADADVSGQYTDPTSGLAQLPTWFSSGGLLILNSGGGASSSGGLQNGFASGFAIASGFQVAAGFQRPVPGTFARINFFSGFGTATGTKNQYLGNLTAGFISHLRTTGSGGGFTYSPQSGVGIVV